MTPRILALVLLLSGTPSVAFTQGQDNDLWTRMKYKWTGDDIPEYFVVQGFYQRLSNCYKLPDNLGAYRRELTALGVRAGSPAEQLVTDSMLAATKIRKEVLDLRSYVKDEAGFKEVQKEFIRRKVKSLREVYAALRRDLSAAGVSLRLLDEYLQLVVRPTLAIHSSNPDSDEMQIFREFEQQDPSQKSAE
jgi:hypothetical protein